MNNENLNGMKRLTIVVFGGTGDLMKRKLVPALASLLYKKIISSDSTIIGIARGDLNDESYKNVLIESAKNSVNKEQIKQLNIKFFRGDANNPESLAKLSDFIKSIEPKEGRNRILYLSTSFNLFPAIIQQLKAQSLHEQKNSNFVRVVFEKPFGFNLESSNILEKSIHNVFSEDQIFRIDHYLAKEALQNILTFRFFHWTLSIPFPRSPNYLPR